MQPFHADPLTVSAIMRLQAARGFAHRNVAYRAALAGEIRLLDIPPGPTPRLKPLLRQPGPAVAIIGDDGGISSGPRDFPQARRLIDWSTHIMVHATGAEEDHYRLVVEAARNGGRVLMVETNTAAEAAWMALAEAEIERRKAKRRPGPAVLLIQVPAHMPPHPLMPAGAS